MPLRIFPVADPPGASYSDDWHAPRQSADGTVRQHLGNDLFAADGTPVLAPDDGTIRYTTDPIGGPSFYLKADDGVTYYGAHLSAYEGDARRVQAGEVVAYVGHGGNAANTSSHLHFEVHPGGGPAVDPFPYLNQASRQSAPVGASAPSGLGGRLLVLAAVGMLGGAIYMSRHPSAARGLARWYRRFD